MINLATDLANAGYDTWNYGSSYESGPTYEVDLTKNSDFRAYRNSSATTFTNLTTHLYVY